MADDTSVSSGPSGPFLVIPTSDGLAVARYKNANFLKNFFEQAKFNVDYLKDAEEVLERVRQLKDLNVRLWIVACQMAVKGVTTPFDLFETLRMEYDKNLSCIIISKELEKIIDLDTFKVKAKDVASLKGKLLVVSDDWSLAKELRMLTTFMKVLSCTEAAAAAELEKHGDIVLVFLGPSMMDEKKNVIPTLKSRDIPFILICSGHPELDLLQFVKTAPLLTMYRPILEIYLLFLRPVLLSLARKV